ncbi:ribosomal protein S6 kinase-like 1 isoform X7 [Stegostoma tigrinum]|uniref:ribosomal protein S6 kinase-like 1 isoform X7 n=1 Tax=Stegostoma tigrinum TaxID=3053191 RepID=UPI0028705A78|nr:ribosomal protein S6 kinase-like 1 isoform X7 [Stegostoma tigrinum]
MYSLPGRRSPGQDAETCSRPLSQARVYLEQIRSRVSPNISESHQALRSTTTKRDYLVDAAKQIRLALDREVNEDYEAAFNYYKNGVDLLLKGVQVDPNKERREAVKRKTTQYLKRAEEIFNSHLQGSLGNGTDDSGGFSSLRFRPNRILSSPVEDLKTSKVIAIVDKVLLVQNPSYKEPFIVKSLPKCSLVNRECPTIIPQGVPFMVQLLQYFVSDDAVFLHLEHIPAGKLWSQLRHLRQSVAEKGLEFPECSSPHHTTIKMRNSYTAPSLSSMCYDNSVLPPNSKREQQKDTKKERNGHVCLTYFGQWNEVEVQCSTKAIEDMYCAPEVGGVGRVTEACDWWSLGALLFELLTGTTLSQCYPSRIHSHTQLRLPDHLSPAAVSLLQQLLQWDYRCRLGSGENGAQEIKSHSFFRTLNWDKLNGYR